MNLNAFASGILHYGNVGGNNGGHVIFCRSIHNLVHLFHFLVVYDGIDGEVGLYVVLLANRDYVAQVVESEVVRRAGTHVKLFNAKVYGIASCLYCSHQRLV